jgi:hypothetical protein
MVSTAVGSMWHKAGGGQEESAEVKEETPGIPEPWLDFLRLQEHRLVLWTQLERNVRVTVVPSSFLPGENSDAADAQNWLLLGYADGFQIWNVTDSKNIHEIWSVRDFVDLRECICVRLLPMGNVSDAVWKEHAPLVLVV